MPEKHSSVNKDSIKMTGTDKTDYEVPSFLISSLQNTPGKKEFYNTYSENKDEIPLWWSRDVDLPLTKKENRRAGKKAISIKNALEQQRIRAESANKRFLRIIQKQEKEYKKRCEMLEKQVADKLEELEILNNQNKLEYQNRLLQLEIELQKANLQKEFYQKEKQKLLEFEEMNLAVIEEQEERENVLASIDEELEKEKENSKEIKNSVDLERAEKGLLPITPIIDEESKEAVESNLDLNPKVNFDFEAYDSRNIMEIKHLSLINKETSRNELKNISFDIKKQGVTVVYSQSESVIANILASVMRTLPSNIQKTNGEIRLLGQSITELLSNEYRTKIKKIISCQEDIEDKIVRSSKKISSAFNQYKISAKTIIGLLNSFELNKDIYYKKQNKLSQIQRKKLAIALALSLNMPLTILYEPQEDMEDADKKQLINILNSTDYIGALFILTTDKKLSASILNSALYIFNNK